ncbi:unnamed protein product, partial [Didymodactylos carnosus]
MQWDDRHEAKEDIQTQNENEEKSEDENDEESEKKEFDKNVKELNDMFENDKCATNVFKAILIQTYRIRSKFMLNNKMLVADIISQMKFVNTLQY